MAVGDLHIEIDHDRRHKANFASIKLDDNPPPLTPEDMATWIPIGDTSTDEDGFPLDPEA